MKKLNIFFAIAAASLLVACSSDEEAAALQDGQTAPLTISAELSTTRLALDDTYFSNGDTIAIFLNTTGYDYTNVPARWRSSSTLSLLETVTLNAYHAKVKAYYPYQPTPEKGEYLFDVTKQINYLYGISNDEVYNYQSHAVIPFKHAMSRVRFNISYKSGVTLQKMQIVSPEGEAPIYKRGYVLLYTDGDNMATLQEDPATADSPLDIPAAVGKRGKTISQDVLLLPNSNDQVKVLLQLQYDNGKQFSIPVTLPALERNGYYVYPVNIVEDPYNGYDHIDLGLPSGKQWATVNFGAASAEASGYYNTWTEDDAVHAAWKGLWHTPTADDMQELLDECSWSWTAVNGVNGFTVKSKRNSNSIFMPAAGIQVEGTVSEAGRYGFYFTSTPNADDDQYVFELSFYKAAWGEARYIGNGFRNTQCSIRPVADKATD